MGHDARPPDNRHLMQGLPRAVISGCILVLSTMLGCADQNLKSDYPLEDGAVYAQPEPAASQPRQLDQLVAPIALYPDPVLAQVLAASTYPAQIVEAERWMQQNTTLKGDALAKAADTQSWDPSVKSLTQFPDLLAMMDKNLAWTSALGEAYLGNTQAVMDAVQRLRHQAQAAGNLKSTPQQNVTTQGQTIVIEPVVPDVVYVPQYDPWLIYGGPIGVWPGWVGWPSLYFVGVGVAWGYGFGPYGGFGWCWPHWRPNWGGHGIVFGGTPWKSGNPTFWSHHPGLQGGLYARPPGLARPPGGGFRPGVSAVPSSHPGAPFRGGVQPRGGMSSGAFSGSGHGHVAGGFSAHGGASMGGGGQGGGAHR
jgi:hypothetical protein